MAVQAAVEVRALSKRFDETVALDGALASAEVVSDVLVGAVLPVAATAASAGRG